MKIKHLFTVPQGENVTEKHLRRVLISSICSILLCMTCLVGATWAWFTVSIENANNVIEIATATATATVKDVTQNADGSYTLLTGNTYEVSVVLTDYTPTADHFNKTGKMYVTMTAVLPDGETGNYRFTFTENAEKKVSLTVNEDTTLSISSVSWFSPVNAVEITTEMITIGDAPPNQNP